MPPNDPHAAEDRRRLAIAFILSFVLMLGYKHFIIDPREKAEHAGGAVAASATQAPGAPGAAETAPKAPVPRDAALRETARIPIDGKRLTGSLSLRGGRLDDLRLKDFNADNDESGREKEVLLSPAGTARAYYVDAGWLNPNEAAPYTDAATPWQKAPGSADTLTSGGAPVILRWDNGQGLVFERRLSLDDEYLFTVEQSVTNRTNAPVTLNAYHTAARNDLPPDFRGIYTAHEGPVGEVGGHAVDPQYKSLAGGVGYDLEDRTGWMGFSDRYWLVAMLPKPDQSFNLHLDGKNFQKPGQHYQASLVDAAVTVPPGQAATDKSYLFTGVKDLGVIQSYQQKYGFNNLELAIDFGIYYIITKPFYYLLHFLIGLTGSVGCGMLAMTVIVRGGMFPIMYRSSRSMAKMKVVGPKLKEIQERYKDNKEKMMQEVQDLYQREDVNMFGSCLPQLLTIPVFFALYKVIMISVELRQAPFWGWIHDLSAPDPTTVFNLFGFVPWSMNIGGFELPHIGGWPIIYCLTMLFQKRISPPLPDPAQERMQAWFPYVFSIMMAQFPVGLVIYYSWSNLLGVIQQYYILRSVSGQQTSLLRGHPDRRKKRAAPEPEPAAEKPAAAPEPSEPPEPDNLRLEPSEGPTDKPQKSRKKNRRGKSGDTYGGA